MTELEDRKIVLTDEEGEDHEFEVLDIIEVDGSEYAILFPTEENEDADPESEEEEAIILKIEQDENGEEILREIEDDEEWERVADAYDEIVQAEEDDTEE